MALVKPIRVEGLREFSRSLRRMDADLPKGLREAGNAAAKIVVNAAKPKVPTGPGKGGHAKSSIKAASTRTAARVQGGGKRFPYYPWLDFGGRVGRKRSIRRPFLREGRYIWAAYAANDERIQEELVDQLKKVAQNAGLGVSGD
ncbi:hypothetical protein ACL02T_20370 [Pseudonocardia sp. RS010]|uniref:hypothetical protein n=1 Tax=Pseudonocardia sp. RS010 TaxID=3385979 RepID=UPI00399F16F3